MGLAVPNTPLSGRRVARGSETLWPPFEQDADARRADARHGRARAPSAGREERAAVAHWARPEGRSEAAVDAGESDPAGEGPSRHSTTEVMSEWAEAI